jgi:hypothetical protein
MKYILINYKIQLFLLHHDLELFVQHDLLNRIHFQHHFEVVMLFEQLQFEDPIQEKMSLVKYEIDVLLQLFEHFQSNRLSKR